MTNQKNRTNTRILVLQVLLLAATFAAEPAFAQLDKVNRTAQMVQIALASVSAISCSIALMFSGYKMMFQSAKWAEIANIVYGSIFVGGATGIGAWLMS